MSISHKRGKGWQVFHLYPHSHISVARGTKRFTLFLCDIYDDYLYPPYFVFVNGNIMIYIFAYLLSKYTGLVDKVTIIESDRGSENDPPGRNTNYSPGILDTKLSLDTLI